MMFARQQKNPEDWGQENKEDDDLAKLQGVPRRRRVRPSLRPGGRAGERSVRCCGTL